MRSSISDMLDNKQLFHLTTTHELHQKQQCNLPALPKKPMAPESARESDDARLQRKKELLSPKSNAYSRIIIPPKKLSNALTSLSSPSPHADAFDTSPFDEERDYATEALHEEEAQLLKKQQKTSACFHALKELSNTKGPLKNVLGQIYTVLQAAAYVPPTYKLGQDIIEDEEKDIVDLNMLRKKNASAIEEGKEFFTLLHTTQRQVKACEKKKKKNETKLGLEISIQKDLQGTLDVLYVDLEQMREHHKKNQELLESERIAVNELELELEALTAQEINKKKEVDILESQKEKQLLHLQALHAKTIELDVVSSASMKKHIEEQKQCEYEDQLKRQLQELSNQNKSLEKEVQDMTEKASSLDIQLEQDRQLLDQIEKEVIQAEAQRDELVEKVDATRSCHTPRPDWDAIIEEIPEIVSNTYQWDEVEGYDEEEEAEVDDAMEITSEEFDQGTTSKTGGVRKKIITSRLIKEMLHWIESLQKHCGVDLHLSNLWRDVEEARIELNILHQQLDHAMRQHPKSPSSSLIKHNVEATQAHSRRPIIKPERILTLGNSAEVPKFLQHTGRVTKRHITKKELKIIIRNVWNEKKRLQERSGMDLRLEDILYEKLKQKHGFQPVIAEWGYNILIALNMYVSDSEVELFLLCLTGAISEQVYDDQENMINSCQEILMKLCHAYQNESFLKEKKIRLKDALLTLRNFFPLKTSSQLQAIEEAIFRDIYKKKTKQKTTKTTTSSDTDTICMNRIKHYSTNDGDFFLFLENIFSSGSFASARGFFIKTIRTQHFKEIQDYFTSVVTNLYETKDRTHHGRVTLLQIQQAMLQIDHHMDILQINQQIYKTLGLKNKIQINWNEQIDYIMFLKEMSTKNVLKYTLNYDPNAEINMQKRPIRSHLIMQSAMNKIKAIMTTTKAITEPENKE